MGKIAILFGILLILLGIGGFIGTGSAHKTALIPAYFGAPIALFGVLALKPNLRMHAMHGAVLVGLLAFLGALVMVIKVLARLAGGQPIERPIAFWMQLLMLLISGVFVLLCVRSFIQARRNRTAPASAP